MKIVSTAYVMLSEEFNYYVNNLDDLLPKYLGKFIVIKGQEVICAFDSEAEAYVDVVNSNELGKVLIQQCLPGKENYTQTFHSRVIF